MNSSCSRCGVCCRVFAVTVTPFDILRIAEATGKEPSGFVDAIEVAPQKTRRGPSVLIDGKMLKLALRWSIGRVCHFYSADGCTIYDSRPMVCRLHPFELRGGELTDNELRMCAERWQPEDKSTYLKDFRRCRKERSAYRKMADEWNRKGGSLADFLAFALRKAKETP